MCFATAPPAHRARDSRAVRERITPCGVPASVANQVRPSTYIAGAVQLDVCRHRFPGHKTKFNQAAKRLARVPQFKKPLRSMAETCAT